MSLKVYEKKRKFDKTPEPKPEKNQSGNELKFVIQKHDATRLHYDLRLELNGVLKSWAVPKGPSLNPSVKRLSIMVEDHPIEYANFEGIIPEGNYGAGTVMVWDEGTYHGLDHDGNPVGPEQVEEMLDKGNLKVRFEGKKINGSFALVKTGKYNDGKSNQWLLIKKNDDYASEKEITDENKSVKSNLDLDEIAQSSPREWHSNEMAAELSFEAKFKAPMPSLVKPMLATLADKPFDSDDWLFEIKWDGYRAIAEVAFDSVKVYSRNGNSFNLHFPQVVDALSELGIKAVFDGEIVVLDDEGKARFDLMQNYKTTQTGNLVFYVFDILYLNQFDLRRIPLVERKKILKEVLPKDHPVIRYNDHIMSRGIDFFRLAEQHQLEGIIAKKADSVYLTNKRTRSWLKIKTHRRQEAVIVGMTIPKGGRKFFGALVLAIYEEDKWKYAGRVGSGFDEKRLKELYEISEPLFVSEPPFEKYPDIELPVQWIRPELVCEVKFHEWTDDGLFRQPVFVGLREDKQAEEVYRESIIKTKGVIEPKSKGTNTIRPPFDKKKRSNLTFDKINIEYTNKNRTEGLCHLGGNILKLTNLDKIYFPNDGYSKYDLIDYYYKISPFILPYLHDRPESLRRNPNGIQDSGFFHKNMPSSIPEWLQTEKIYSESSNDYINYLICQDVATLVYMANLGCIELNPWCSRLGSLDTPDYIVIDLDPRDLGFDYIIDVTLAVKEVLDKGKIKGFCKTSGSKGMHIYIPLKKIYSYEEGKNFAHLIATLTHRLLHDITSLERLPSKRKNKIYLDYLQNRKGQTLAAPYCVRPRDGATVSTPLAWDEVSRGIRPTDFDIYTIFDRIINKGDLFKGVLDEENDILEALNLLG